MLYPEDWVDRTPSIFILYREVDGVLHGESFDRRHLMKMPPVAQLTGYLKLRNKQWMPGGKRTRLHWLRLGVTQNFRQYISFRKKTVYSYISDDEIERKFVFNVEGW